MIKNKVANILYIASLGCLGTGIICCIIGHLLFQLVVNSMWLIMVVIMFLIIRSDKKKDALLNECRILLIHYEETIKKKDALINECKIHLIHYEETLKKNIELTKENKELKHEILKRKSLGEITE